MPGRRRVTKTLADPDLACSFCGKKRQVVAKLIAGPGVYICDECIDLCNRILGDELDARDVRRRTRSAEPPQIPVDLEQLPDEELIALMVRVHESHDSVDRSVQQIVAVLRGRNVSWTRIGEALNMTKQSAWQRFSGED